MPSVRNNEICDADVLILGGGPAGSATALALRKHAPGLSVLLVESSSYDQPRIGEVLPAPAKVLLEHLGVWKEFAKENHSSFYNTLSAWGQSAAAENHAIYAMRGAGWHLDRQIFDLFLNAQAVQRNVEVLLNTQLETIGKNGNYHVVRFSDGQEKKVRFVVDATGRRAFLARKMGAEILSNDRLVSFSRYFTFDEQPAPETFVESFADGWWYSARAGKRRIVSCLTDADIAAKLNLKDEQSWRSLLEETRQIKKSIGGGLRVEESLTRPANSARLNRVCAGDWLAVGDAASAFDPLSSQGITKALRSAVFASYAISDLLVKGDENALARYEKFIEMEFSVYRKLYEKYYANEQRWRSNLFWQRRHGEL